MRMRKKRNLDERVAASDDVCLGWLQDYVAEQRGDEPMEQVDTMKIFGNNNPLYLEIGCGKGKFIQQMAEENPDINFIAVEQTRNVLITAMERTQKSGIKNLKYYIGKAEYLEKAFKENSVDMIILNFSCPYPKEKYAKHRLTHELFLKIYSKILKPEHIIKQKTDNSKFFQFSINHFSACGWQLRNVTFDLHNSKIEGNIMTEYEERFSSQGFPIYYLEAVNKRWE